MPDWFDTDCDTWYLVQAEWGRSMHRLVPDVGAEEKISL